MSIQIESVDLCPFYELSKNGSILFGIKLVFFRILTGRYKTYSFVDSLHFVDSVHATHNPLSQFFDSFVLLLCFFGNCVIDFHKGFLKFVQIDQHLITSLN